MDNPAALGDGAVSKTYKDCPSPSLLTIELNTPVTELVQDDEGRIGSELHTARCGHET